MGNTQSSETPRRGPQKLTKPRVGNLGAASTASVNQQSSKSALNVARFSNSYAVGSAPVSTVDLSSLSRTAANSTLYLARNNDNEPVVARRASRGDLNPPSSLVRSKSYDAEAVARRRSQILVNREGAPRPNRASTTVGEVNGKPSNVERFVPASEVPLFRNANISPNRLHGRESRGSYRHVTPAYDGQRPPHRGDQRDVPQRSYSHKSDASQGAEPAEQSSQPRDAPNGPISRTNSELSMYPPTRRRSLVETPGVATRSEPVKLQKPTRSKYRKSLPATPSESGRTSSEFSAPRHLSFPPQPLSPPPPPPRLAADPSERVVTPCEADYQQLGGMKFGSLRITNGTPTRSPAPPRSGKGSNLAGTDSHPSRDHFDRDAPDPHSEVDASHEARRQVEAAIVQPEPENPTASPVFLILNDAAGGIRALEEAAVAIGSSSGSPDNSSPSPASTSESSNIPELEITSKHTEHDDELFENEDEEPEYESEEYLHVRSDSNAKSVLTEGSQLDRSQKSLRSVTRSDSGFVSTASSDSARKPLSQADSGYSSNVSLYSLHKSSKYQKADEFASVPSGRPSPDALNRNSSSAVSVNHKQPDLDETHVPQKSSAPVLPSVKGALSSITPRPSLSSLSHASIRLPSLKSSKSRLSQSRSRPGSSLSKVRSSDEEPATGALEHSYEGPHRSTSGRKFDKLHRLLSSSKSKELATSYAPHNIHQVVPSVPNDVEHRLHEHNGRFPTSPKRLALRAQSSKETLKTIMSVEESTEPAVESTYESDRLDGTHNEMPSRQKSFRRRSIQTVSHSLTQVTPVLPAWQASPHRSSGQWRARGPSRDRYDEDSDGDDVTDDHLLEGSLHVASMTDLRHSAGNSAFDQAFASMPSQTRASPAPLAPETTYEPALRKRASAPDFGGTRLSPISPSPDLLMQATSSGFPPPVSMQTRGLKTVRNRLSKQFPVPARLDPSVLRRPLSHHGSQESLRNRPVQSSPLSHTRNPLEAVPRPPSRMQQPINHLRAGVPLRRPVPLRGSRSEGNGRPGSSSQNDPQRPQFINPAESMRHAQGTFRPYPKSYVTSPAVPLSQRQHLPPPPSQMQRYHSWDSARQLPTHSPYHRTQTPNNSSAHQGPTRRQSGDLQRAYGPAMRTFNSRTYRNDAIQA